LPHTDPAAPSTPPTGASTPHAGALLDAPSPPHGGVITHHWVSDAEWGEIEEIVVYGDAA
jgi:hypothetical protein